MDKAAALEYSQSLAQIGDGWWKQLLWAAREQVPEAMGMTVDEWRQTYYGHLHLPAPERKEAVLELAAEGLKNPEIAAVLGVSKETVKRDKRPRWKRGSSDPPPSLEPAPPTADTGSLDPAPGQVSLLDLFPDEAAERRAADEQLAALVTTDEDRARSAFRRAIDEVTTAQARIVEWHDRWTPEQRSELAAALNLARRDLHAAPSKLEVVR